MQFRFNTPTARFVLSASMLAVLAACGGGGGGSNASKADGTTTITGVAAIGAPIVGGTVNLKCASGVTATVTTNVRGAWSADLKDSDYPCAARVTGGTANGAANALSLHSVAQSAGVTNITPLTDLITGILAGQDPATWYDHATSGDLNGAVTASGLSTALNQLTVALSTLPGKPALPNGFDPLTSRFSAEPGDAGDDLLEHYGSALAAAGLTQTEAAAHVAAGDALTQTATAATFYTTPNLSAFRGGASTNLDGTTALSLPDPNRGTVTTKIQTLDTDGNATALANGSPFGGIVSLMGNRVGQLCNPPASGSTDSLSQYVYVSDELTEVTDMTELRSQVFDEYENCVLGGTSVFTDTDSFEFREGSATTADPDDITPNIAAAFTTAGVEEEDSILRAKAYKYVTSGATRYVYLMVVTKKGSTTPAINGDTDYVLMGVSQ